MAKLSATQTWMFNHPSDDPPPRNSGAASAWRRKRWLEVTPEMARLREKYEAAMAAKRAAASAQSMQS